MSEDVTAALGKRRVVLGVTGGIAAYKAAMVARGLVTAGLEVDVVLTRGATRFIGAATFEGITGRPVRSEVWDDIPNETHVALARQADAVAVYPATAHVIAKAAAGLADDLLTTTLLAATCPVVLAPAMHTEMWQHPATQRNVAALREREVRLVGPVEGALMGGDTGLGRAADPEVMVAAIMDALAGPEQDLAGRTVVVTAGATREPFDPVRFLSNRATGKMGFALAHAAAARGATVRLVTGPSYLDTPRGVDRHDIVTAREMHEAVLALAAEADVIIKAAAVSDFRPSETSEQKIKKTGGVPTVSLVANPDILADLGERRRQGTLDALLVGFAAETQDVEANGREKLRRKGCDLLVVNDVTEAGAGFAHETNRVVILGADGGRVDVALAAKAKVAERILDEVVARL